MGALRDRCSTLLSKSDKVHTKRRRLVDIQYGIQATQNTLHMDEHEAAHHLGGKSSIQRRGTYGHRLLNLQDRPKYARLVSEIPALSRNSPRLAHQWAAKEGRTVKNVHLLSRTHVRH